MKIGEKIKTIRKSKKITQKEFAKIINKSERMVQKYENDEVTPSIEMLEKIANALEVPTSYLTSEGEKDIKLQSKILYQNEKYINMLENVYMMLEEFKSGSLANLSEIEEKIISVGMDNFKKIIPNEELECLYHALSIVLTLQQYFFVEDENTKERYMNSLKKMIKFQYK